MTKAGSRSRTPSARRSRSKYGRELFVTSLTGEYVRIYPMPVWLEHRREARRRCRRLIPSQLRFLDRVNYFGQIAELDAQGRVLIPARLRDSATMTGDVDVLGQLQLPRRLEPRSLPRQAAARTVHRRRRARAVGVRDLMTRARAGDDRRSAAASAAGTRRPLRRLHGRPRRPRARAARGGRDAPHRARSRRRRARARARDARAVARSRRARARRLPRRSTRCSTTAASTRIDGALADLGVSSMQFDDAGPRLQLPARRAARHAHGSQRAATPPPISSRARQRARARRRDLPVRRRALLAAHRARDRRRARRTAPIRHDRAAGRDRPARDSAARLPAHRSGDAHVPGAAHLGQPRARRARSLPRNGGRGACAPARGWSSSRFTRSRIGSSSTRFRALEQRDDAGATC